MISSCERRLQPVDVALREAEGLQDKHSTKMRFGNMDDAEVCRNAAKAHLCSDSVCDQDQLINTESRQFIFTHYK